MQVHYNHTQYETTHNMHYPREQSEPFELFFSFF